MADFLLDLRMLFDLLFFAGAPDFLGVFLAFFLAGFFLLATFLPLALLEFAAFLAATFLSPFYFLSWVFF